MVKLMNLVLLSTISIFIMTAGVTAQGDGSLEQEWRDKVNELSGQIQIMEEDMKTEAYTLAELGEYQYTYLQMFYYGKVLANRSDDGSLDRSNGNPRLLLDEGYIPFWPHNPLSDWEEVIVALDREDLQPGDVLLEVCPADYNSMSYTGLAAASFNLYMVATDPELAAFGQMFIYGENKDWAAIPENAVYGLSYYVVSDAKRREAYSKRKTE